MMYYSSISTRLGRVLIYDSSEKNAIAILGVFRLFIAFYDYFKQITMCFLIFSMIY